MVADINNSRLRQSKMTTLGIIQARMNSTRYYGKMMEEICGKPLLYHLVERLKHSPSIDIIVVASTYKAEDGIILDKAEEYGVFGFAGSEHDVLKRFIDVAVFFKADVVVRVPGDQPLFEPLYADCCIEKLLDEQADFCNVDGAIWGTGPDVMTVDAMDRLDNIADKPHQREHVIPGFIEHPELFKLTQVSSPDHLRYPGLRLAVDTPEDMQLARAVYENLYDENSIVDLADAVELIESNPQLADLNSKIKQRKMTSSELKGDEE